jgi:hypothetical protein
MLVAEQTPPSDDTGLGTVSVDQISHLAQGQLDRHPHSGVDTGVQPGELFSKSGLATSRRTQEAPPGG